MATTEEIEELAALLEKQAAQRDAIAKGQRAVFGANVSAQHDLYARTLRRAAELLRTIPGLQKDRDLLLNRVAEKPVAWRCRDFADGWILCGDEAEALEYQKQTGCLMEALHRRIYLGRTAPGGEQS